MGFLKICVFIATPVIGFTIMAFRLGRQLPIASRLFGNYLGLGYVYFKSILKFVKPVDHMPFEMISLARKTSQQSQALRRQLKSTLKRVKQDINAKQKQTFKDLQQQMQNKNIKTDIAPLFQDQQVEQPKQKGQMTGNLLILSIMKNREQLLSSKQQKRKSRRFFDQV